MRRLPAFKVAQAHSRTAGLHESSLQEEAFAVPLIIDDEVIVGGWGDGDGDGGNDQAVAGDLHATRLAQLMYDVWKLTHSTKAGRDGLPYVTCRSLVGVRTWV